MWAKLFPEAKDPLLACLLILLLELFEFLVVWWLCWCFSVLVAAQVEGRGGLKEQSESIHLLKVLGSYETVHQSCWPSTYLVDQILDGVHDLAVLWLDLMYRCKEWKSMEEKISLWAVKKRRANALVVSYCNPAQPSARARV